jgi:hypothetical protein
MTRNFALIFLILLAQAATAQRSMPLLTPSPYALQDLVIAAEYQPVKKNSLSVHSIRVIDNRFDTTKQGFYPVLKYAPKQLRFGDNLAAWMHKQLFACFDLAPAATRDLVVIIQDFWFSYFAAEKYTPFKQHLQCRLHYKLELFSEKEGLYYPVRRLAGEVVYPFSAEDSYAPLTDSLFNRIQFSLSNDPFTSKEIIANAITAEKLDSYLQKKLDRLHINTPLLKGVYASFDDFLQRKISGDSVDIYEYKDFYGRQTVACHVGLMKNNSLQPGNRFWGYYDGRNLFVNTGNGLYVRVMPWFHHYILADLQQIVLSRKRKSLVSESKIGETSFEILKAYAKAYHLFFELNFDTGELE